MTKNLYDILTAPKRIKADIKRIAERIEDTRLMMLPSAIRYDKDKIISSPSDPMLKFAEKIDELEKKKQALLSAYISSRDAMTELIDKLNDPIQKDIIQARFMKELKFYQIAESIGYSEAQTYRIYVDAIDALESMIKHDSE